MYDIITIGDTTVDVFLTINESAALDCRLDKTACELVLGYATKIPVSNMTEIVAGGNAANHAIGAARLGLKTAIVTHVGSDEHGQRVTARLRQSHVATTHVTRDKNKKTNYSTVLEFAGDRTILVFHEDRHYELPKLAPTTWMYFSSISGNHKEFNAALATHVKQHNIQLGFNPGTMQLKLGAKGLRPILAVTTVLFVNKEEAIKLLERKMIIKDLLRGLHELGPGMAVITDGQKGSACFDGKEMYDIGIFDTPIVERTGCGDAYASGFIAALFYGHDVREAMRWGSFNAAGVIEHVGPHAGLMTRSTIERLAQKNPEFQPTILNG